MENLRNPRVLGTQYRVYDKDGKYKRTIDKTDEKNLDESDWLKGVTCFVINEKGEVLIEVRANKGLTPGKNDLCSGHLDNDETETQAMIRELKEEAGDDLNLEIFDSIGIYYCHKKNIDWLFVIYLMKYISGNFKIMEPTKCEGYKFFSYEEAMKSTRVTEGSKYLIKTLRK